MADSFANYDRTDIFAPDGSVKPLMHIKNSVELGNTTIAVGNSKCAVLVVHTGTISPIYYKQPKIFKISEKCVFSFSGITNDGLEMANYLVNCKIWEEIYKNRAIHPIKVFDLFSSNASLRTIYSRNRMLGAGGILISNYENKTWIVEFSPTGFVQLVNGVCIGTRSQSARTVLESNADQLEAMDKQELIGLALQALKNAHSDEMLSTENVEVWVVEDSVYAVHEFRIE